MHTRSVSRFARRALLAQILALPAVHAATTWNGGGSDTRIDNAANWSGALPGVAAVTFGTGGNTATIAADTATANATFTSVTFNRASTGGFAIDGPGNLVINGSASGTTANLVVSSASTGASTVNAPLVVNTTTNTLLVINNQEAQAGATTLAINSGITASGGAGLFALRYNSGAGAVTRIAGALGNLSQIQQGNTGGWLGSLVIAGNQSTGAPITLSTTTGFGVTGADARLVLGDAATDVQSWGAITLNRELDLAIGGRISATSFTGNVAGTKIVGQGESVGTLELQSGVIGANVALGGVGANENNLALVKTGTGTLTISSADNTYSGGTVIVQGAGFPNAGLVLGANNALGTGPLTIGTEATTGGGARMRMAGFNQTVSALSSGSVGVRVIENNGQTNSLLTVNQAGDTAYTGILRDRSQSNAAFVGTLGLTKSGGGTLALGGDNVHTGATTLTGGTLEVASLGNAGIERLIDTASVSNQITVNDTTGLEVGMTLASPSVEAGLSIVSIEGNVLTMSGTGTVAGSGVGAKFGYASALGLASASASNLVFAGGAIRYVGAGETSNRGFTVGVGHSARIEVTSADATLTLAGGSDASDGGLVKSGAGELVLSGLHGYTGDTVVAGGRLTLGEAERIADGSRLVLEAGVIDLAGYTETFAALDVNGASTLDLGASGVAIFASSAGQTWTSGLSIAGSFVSGASVKFGDDAGGLTLTQLGLITIDGFTGVGIDAGGFLTAQAIPEPGAFATLAGAVALGAGLLRRRRAG